VIDIGSTVDRNGAKKIWLAPQGGATAFLASAEEVQFVALDPERLRTRHVLDFRGLEFTRIECRTKDASFVARRETDRPPGTTEFDDAPWVVEAGGTERRADAILLAEALAESRQLLIEEFLRPRDAADPPSLDGSLGSVTFHTVGAQPQTIYFEAPSTDLRDRGLNVYAASRSTDRARFRVVSRWPRRLERGGWVFVDREISKLVPGSVFELRMRADGKAWTLANPPGSIDRFWSLAGGGPTLRPEQRLDNAVVAKLLDALRAERFRVRSFEPRLDRSQWETLGIGTHRFWRRVEVTVAADGYQGFRTLTIGYRQKGEKGVEYYPARVDGVAIPVTLTSAVPTRVERLVEHLSTITSSSESDGTSP